MVWLLLDLNFFDSNTENTLTNSSRCFSDCMTPYFQQKVFDFANWATFMLPDDGNCSCIQNKIELRIRNNLSIYEREDRFKTPNMWTRLLIRTKQSFNNFINTYQYFQENGLIPFYCYLPTQFYYLILASGMVVIRCYHRSVSVMQ